MLALADDFIEATVNAACRLAKHRGARTLDVKDVQMYLGRIYFRSDTFSFPADYTCMGKNSMGR